MHCNIISKDIEEISRNDIVQQTAFWASVKHRQGLDPVAFNYDVESELLYPGSDKRSHVEGDILVLIKYIDDVHCIATIPYGPVSEPVFENQGPFLEELSEVLRLKLPAGCILIRYDLPWENQWSADEDYYDENGIWKGPPAFNSQEFRVNFNTHNWNLVKSRSDNLPSNTIFLDLKKGDDDLLRNMKPKTRYNIRLSSRRGVRVHSYGMEMLDTWYELYTETAIRNGVTLHGKEYFQSVLSSYHETHTPGVEIRLLMAEHEGEYLAAMFLVISNKRASYLYGASSSRKRNLMATYAIQWEAMRIAMAEGCTAYDLFGVAPNPNPSHPMHGLYRFKSGFGGEMYHRMGCWDYPLDELQYQAFQAQEVTGQSYHVH